MTRKQITALTATIQELLEVPEMIDGREYLPPLKPTTPLANVRRLAAAATAIAEELETQVTVARNRGFTWDQIAEAIVSRYPNGSPAALGSRFAGGTSTTTIRNMYGRS